MMLNIYFNIGYIIVVCFFGYRNRCAMIFFHDINYKCIFLYIKMKINLLMYLWMIEWTNKWTDMRMNDLSLLTFFLREKDWNFFFFLTHSIHFSPVNNEKKINRGKIKKYVPFFPFGIFGKTLIYVSFLSYERIKDFFYLIYETITTINLFFFF